MRNEFGLRKSSIYPTVIYNFDGVEYCWSGWFGCQLVSYEWIRKPAGTTRLLRFGLGCGVDSVEMTLFTTQRHGLMYRHTWSVNASGTIDEHNKRVIELQRALRKI